MKEVVGNEGFGDEGFGRRLRARVGAADDGLIVGHALDLDDLDARLVIELRIDGEPLRLARACRFDAALFSEGLGDGCYGFLFALDRDLARAGALVEARLANSGERLGEPFRLGAPRLAPPGPAELRWIGGLRIAGWIAGEQPAKIVRALVDGEVVAEARVDRWTFLPDGATSARAFEIDLPPDFADGRARVVWVVDDEGRELPGSPLAVLAFEDGLERFLLERAEFEAEGPRGAIFDAIFARSHPFRDYANWAKRFPAPVPALTRPAKAAVALLGGGDAERSLQSLEHQIDCDWVAAALGGPTSLSFDPAELEALLNEDAPDAEIVVLAPAGAVFAPHALAAFAEALQRLPEASLAYGDLTFSDASATEWPIALTAFDYERMLEQGYAALCLAVRRSAIEVALAARIEDPFSLLFSRLNVETKSLGATVAHVPGFRVGLPQIDLDGAAEMLRRAVDAHLADRKTQASVEVMFSARFPAVHVSRKPVGGPASVIVTARGPVDWALIEELDGAIGDAASEVLVVVEDETSVRGRDGAAALGAGRVRIASVPATTPPEQAYNAAANIATGEYLAFLSDDMRPQRTDWLAEMLGRLSEPHVGAVTATVLAPSGLIQSCGLAVGPDFGVSRAFRDLANGESGYAEMMATAHEVGAANSAGMLVRRGDFLKFGGFDVQRYGPSLSSVDFCLRLRAAGMRIVATPYAKLIRTGADRVPPQTSDVGDRRRRELEVLRVEWGETLANDAYYSSLLSISGAPFSALAWPIRDCRPRLSLPPQRRAFPEWL